MPVGRKLTQEEITKRLSETKPCLKCGGPTRKWRVCKRKSSTSGIHCKETYSRFCSKCHQGHKLDQEEINKRLAETKECNNKHCSNRVRLWKWAKDKEVKSGFRLIKNPKNQFCSHACGHKLSQEEFNKRLLESIPCKNCGRQIKIWKLYKNDKCKSGLQLMKREHKFCSKWCSRNHKIDNPDYFPPNKRLITAFGETKTMMDWSKDLRCKVGYYGLVTRIVHLKLNPEEAISKPNRKRGRAEQKVIDEAMQQALAEVLQLDSLQRLATKEYK